MNLFARVHTPVGAFVGNVNNTPASKEDLTELRDSIQRNIQGLEYLVLNQDDYEHAISGEVLKHSVISFRLVE
jgi:hypothetical protein